MKGNVAYPPSSDDLTDALFDAEKKRIDEWNAVLDKQ
jgi:hypothetical protein